MYRILVVDDDEYVRTRCEREFRKKGYEVILAKSGKEGLAAYLREAPHAVVLDIRMPDIDGIEVMDRILAINPRTPVILNTGHAGYQDSFLTWSADAYVMKTPDMADLVAHVEKVLLDRYLEIEEPAPYAEQTDGYKL